MNKLRLILACCLLAGGCGRKETAPAVSPPAVNTSAVNTSAVSPEASIAANLPPGPQLVSPENHGWLPRSAGDGGPGARWEFHWKPVLDTSGYEVELLGLGAQKATQPLTTSPAPSAEFAYTFDKLPGEFPRGVAWRVRARLVDGWTAWSPWGLFYVEPSAEATQMVKQLVVKLQDKTRPTKEREAAVGQLGSFHADARDAVPALLKVAMAGGAGSSADDLIVTMYAVRTLEELGPAAQAAVPELIRILQGRDLVQKLLVTGILRTIGPRAAETLPHLVPLLKQPSPEDMEGLDPKLAQGAWRLLRVNGAAAVVSVGGKPHYRDAVVTLVEILEGPDAFAAVAAIGVLSRVADLGADGVPAIPHLVRAISPAIAGGGNLSSSDTRCNAAIALGYIGPAAKEAVPALQALAANHYREPSAGECAAEALTKITGVRHTVPECKPSSGQTAQKASGAADAAAGIDPCSLITKEEAREAMGVPISDPIRDGGRCTYREIDPYTGGLLSCNIEVSVYCGANAARRYREVKALVYKAAKQRDYYSEGVQDVAGIGDDAYWIPRHSELRVLTESAQITVSTSLPGKEGVTGDAVVARRFETAERLAQKALPRVADLIASKKEPAGR